MGGYYWFRRSSHSGARYGFLLLATLFGTQLDLVSFVAVFQIFTRVHPSLTGLRDAVTHVVRLPAVTSVWILLRISLFPFSSTWSLSRVIFLSLPLRRHACVSLHGLSLSRLPYCSSWRLTTASPAFMWVPIGFDKNGITLRVYRHWHNTGALWLVAFWSRALSGFYSPPSLAMALQHWHTLINDIVGTLIKWNLFLSPLSWLR